MFISIRQPNSNFSKFINIDDFLKKTTNLSALLKIYRSIEANALSFDPKEAENLNKINQEFKKRATCILGNPKHWKKTKNAATLGVYPLVKFVKKKKGFTKLNKIFHSIDKLVGHLEESQKEKKEHFLSTINDVFAKRTTDNDEELKRLISCDRIKTSLAMIENHLNTTISNKAKLAIAHSLEIREVLKNDFYVINHGQNLNLMLINVVIRSLKKYFCANSYDHLRMLRHDAHLQHINPFTQDVEWFKKKSSLGEKDHAYRRELICGDIFLESTRRLESALDFFLGRQNIAAKDELKKFSSTSASYFLSGITRTILQHYFQSKKTVDKFLKELQAIGNAQQLGGNLYSIAIPKKKFHEICYLSRSFGVPIKETYEENELESMQDGIHPLGGKRAPQVRLLSHMLTPENGVYIYLSSTAEDEVIERFERQVDLLVQRAQMQFRF